MDENGFTPEDFTDEPVRVGAWNVAAKVERTTGRVDCVMMQVGPVDDDGKPREPTGDEMPWIGCMVPSDPSKPMAWVVPMTEPGTFGVRDITPYIEQGVADGNEHIVALGDYARKIAALASKHAVDEWTAEQSASESVPDDIRALLALGDDK